MGDRITVIGVLGQEPTERTTSRGSLVTFPVASRDRRRDAQGNWSDGPTSWYRVTAWGELGHNALTSLHKGQRVIVQGDLSVNEWDGQDGQRARSVEIRALALGHDLAFGTSTFVRGERPQPSGERPATGERPAGEAPQAEQTPAARPDRSTEWGAPLSAPEAAAPAATPAASDADWLTTPF
jgi:single-strand DNA-binding protein